MPPTLADTRRNWSRFRPMSSWLPGSAGAGPPLQDNLTVPIVFVIVPDPVGAGYVESLSRPGGNATGFMMFEYNFERQMAGTAQADRTGRDAGGGASGSGHRRRDRPVRRHPVVAPLGWVGVGAGRLARPREIERAVTAFARGPNGGLIVTRARCRLLTPRSDHRACGPAQCCLRCTSYVFTLPLAA